MRALNPFHVVSLMCDRAQRPIHVWLVANNLVRQQCEFRCVPVTFAPYVFLPPYAMCAIYK